MSLKELIVLSLTDRQSYMYTAKLIRRQCLIATQISIIATRLRLWLEIGQLKKLNDDKNKIGKRAPLLIMWTTLNRNKFSECFQNFFAVMRLRELLTIHK